jgi:hypothetical protein
MPAQDSLVHGTRLSAFTPQRAQHQAPTRTLASSRTEVPQILKR